MIGKQIRLERIMNRSSARTVIIPMDHGITMGPIPGIVNMKETIEKVVGGGANAIILHKGMVDAGHRGSGKDVGLIMHLSASTALGPDPNAKVQICSVEEALKLGADAVSVHVNLGAETESAMLGNLGEVARKCDEWGLPLLAMMYTRGKKIANQFDCKFVKHAARVGAEVGADVVKVVYTGSPESFSEVVESCTVPVVIAGGEKMETDEELLDMVAASILAGGRGVSIGRNVFQHDDPIYIIKVISRMVHDGLSKEEALAEAKKSK